jgi:hypothetical protein
MLGGGLDPPTDRGGAVHQVARGLRDRREQADN